MALGGILNNSLSGITTAGEALRVTSNNVANVNTEGFARNQVTQSSLVFGGAGSGTRVSGTERVGDQFLEEALFQARGALEQATVSRQVNDRLQSLLGRPDGDNTLAAELNEFFESLNTLALNPTSSVARANVVTNLQETLGEINRLAQSIQALRQDLHGQIQEEVAQANEALTTLAELGPEVVTEDLLGSGLNSVENAFAETLRNLSESLDVRTIVQPVRQLKIATGSGTLLAGDVNTQLSVGDSGPVGPGTVFPAIEISRFDTVTGAQIGTAQPFESSIRAGGLRGLLDLRDQVLPDFAASLGELAARLRDEVNRVSNQFTAVPPPAQLVGNTVPLAGTNAANFTGEIEVTVVNAANAVVASSGPIDLSTAATIDDIVGLINAAVGSPVASFTGGQFTLDASAAGGSGSAVTDGALFATPAPSDRGGRGFSQFFGLNDLVDASTDGIFQNGVTAADAINADPGSVVTIEVVDGSNRVLTTVTVDLNNPATDTYGEVQATLNTSLMAFGSVTLTPQGQLLFQPSQDVQVRVSGDSSNLNGTGLTFSQFTGIAGSATAETALDVSVAERFQQNADLLALGQVDLTAGVGAVALGAGDQRGVLALQALATQNINFDASGRLPQQTASLSGFTSSFLASTGTVASAASAREADAIALELELSQRQSEVSGVNLDEELSNLVVFQNAYNASARILSSVQELFDELLSVV